MVGYGPTHKAFEALDPDRQRALDGELSELLTARNQSGDKALAVPAEYLEIVLQKRSRTAQG